MSRKLIYDAAEALRWAIEHSLCLTLNTKAFERYILSEFGADGKPRPGGIGVPRFITPAWAEQAQIATDLSKVLGDG